LEAFWSFRASCKSKIDLQAPNREWYSDTSRITLVRLFVVCMPYIGENQANFSSIIPKAEGMKLTASFEKLAELSSQPCKHKSLLGADGLPQESPAKRRLPCLNIMGTADTMAAQSECGFTQDGAVIFCFKDTG
jgi:hypothetical protein